MNIFAFINQNNEDAITTEERYYVQRHAFFFLRFPAVNIHLLIWMAHVARVK